jgi:hypothetical protein
MDEAHDKDKDKQNLFLHVCQMKDDSTKGGTQSKGGGEGSLTYPRRRTIFRGASR